MILYIIMDLKNIIILNNIYLFLNYIKLGGEKKIYIFIYKIIFWLIFD